MTTKEFQSGRLTIARERRGYTKEQLAKACGVSRRTVTDWEAGRIQAPPVGRIAEVLRFPSSFFGLELVDTISPERTSFRALTAMSAKQIKMVLANATVVQELTTWIDHQFTTPAVDLPWLDEIRPRVRSEGEKEGLSPSHLGAVEALRALWGLNGKPIADLLALIESRGIRVFSLATEIREVDAFSLWLGERPTIFLNVDKSAERLRFDLAHELGHLLMHRGFVTIGNRSYETEANGFASEFLMPSDGVMAQVKGAVCFDDLFTLKRYWRVSITAMVVRLHQLHLINDWQYRNWMVDLSKRGYRRSEPDGANHERSALLAQVMRLAREDGWSTARLAAELHIPRDDLVGAIAGLTLADVV